MSTFINCKVTWADNSSGVTDETGQELQIYTDSPSFVPNVPVDLLIANHPWMQLLPIAAGATEAQFRLEAPVTFITFRVRQYNANGSGDWSTPAGTPFYIEQTAGVNTPEAPSAPGFVITEGGIVVPPPPPPPPVDPPPPPPPTGGTGTTNNYVFATQFSGVQGQSGWSYKDATGTNMTYNSANATWDGSQTYMGFWPGGAHPGSSVGAMLRWTVPETGVMNIGGTTQLYSTSGNTGVTVTVKHNAATLDTKNLTTTAISTFASTGVAVTAGDTIDFIVTTNGAIANNSISLAPAIQLTTDGTTPANPIVSSVSPTSLAVPVGGIEPVIVTLSSAPSAPASVAISSSDVTKATVPATITIPAGQTSGIVSVTGVAAGTSNVTATYNSSSQVCAVTVSAPVTGTWANAPAGGTVLVDSACASISPFYDVYNSTTFHSDATAPISPSTVMRHRIEATASQGGGQTEYTSPVKYREFYVGMSWRTNPAYLGRPVGNKLFFIRGGPGSNAFFILTGRGSLQITSSGAQLVWSTNGGFENSHTLGADGILAYPNVNNPVITPGVWYKLETYIRASTTQTSRDGVVKWWVNGQLTGSYSQVNYCATDNTALDTFVWNETWDGSGDIQIARSVPWEYYIDHIRIVGKN